MCHPKGPQRVEFLRCSGLKTGMDFAHFGLLSGVVFEGTMGVNERIYPFNSKEKKKKERERERNERMPSLIEFSLGKGKHPCPPLRTFETARASW